MKRLKLRTVFIFGFSAVLGALLLHSSQAVHNAESRLKKLQSSIDEERESIRVLEAEWQFLNNPERLETLAEQYLEVVPPVPNQMKLQLQDIPEATPIQEEQDYKLMMERKAQDVSFDPQKAGQEGAKEPVVKPPAPVVFETRERKNFDGLLNELTSPPAETPAKETP